MIYKTPNLETERLILRRGNKKDYEIVYEYDFRKLMDINNEFKFVKLDPKFIDGFDTYADECEGVYDWIIYLKDCGKPIANIVADREIKNINSIELSCNLHPNYLGQGYMKEAIIEVMRFLYSNGYDSIMYSYDEGNMKSERLSDKIGFEFYTIEENAWVKDNIPIASYKKIMSKAIFDELYKIRTKNR